MKISVKIQKKNGKHMANRISIRIKLVKLILSFSSTKYQITKTKYALRIQKISFCTAVAINVSSVEVYNSFNSQNRRKPTKDHQTSLLWEKGGNSELQNFITFDVRFSRGSNALGANFLAKR